MTLRRRSVKARNHLCCRHHQLQQRRIGCHALQYEIQMSAHVIQPKAKITFFRTKTRQFVNTVTQPVVVMLPVLLPNEVFERFFNHRQPLRHLRQAIQTHQRERRLAIVVDNTMLSLQREVVTIENMDKLAALRILHKCNTGGQLRH